MSRIAKLPINVPIDVDIQINNHYITVKGKKGELTHILNKAVKVIYRNNTLFFDIYKNYMDSWAQAGTARAILNSMIIGVSKGFIKKLQLIGIGYRAFVTDNIINLSLGFSHSINYKLPDGVVAECPSQTEIILKSADKQMLGQVDADLRSYRRPEPYKGKGIRRADQVLRIKETKKK